MQYPLISFKILTGVSDTINNTKEQQKYLTPHPTKKKKEKEKKKDLEFVHLIQQWQWWIYRIMLFNNASGKALGLCPYSAQVPADMDTTHTNVLKKSQQINL